MTSISAGAKRAIVIISISSLIITLFIVQYFDSSKEVEVTMGADYNIAQIYELYNKGEFEGVIRKCNSVFDNHTYKLDDEIKSNILVIMGNSYYELGDKMGASVAYAKASAISDGHNTNLLTAAYPSKSFAQRGIITELTISPNYRKTENMFFQIIPENLAPQKREYGLIVEKNEVLEENNTYITTDWFVVDSSRGYLSMSGGFNYASWQFKDAYGEIIHAVMNGNRKYRDLNDAAINNLSFSQVEIPEGTVEVRVTYINISLKDNSAPLDIPLEIVYGRYPASTVESSGTVINLPDLGIGESLTYKDGKWTASSTEIEVELAESLNLMLNSGDTIFMGGDITGKISIVYEEETPVTNGIYGVRFEVGSAKLNCERIEDSVGLNFDYLIDSEWALGTQNDFDSIYPWSEVKLCSIDSNKNVTYLEAGKNNSDVEGDIMVEIPIHYFKRERIGNYEYIYISATERDGFIIDPAFVSDSGIVEKVYVSAYLSGVNDQVTEIHSKSGDNPLINLSFDKINELIEQKGDNYSEIDLSTLFMIQRLFIVETGVLNSQAIFTGNTDLIWGQTIYADTTSFPTYATESSESLTNTITVANVPGMRRFATGDAVVVYDAKTDDSINPYSNNTVEPSLERIMIADYYTSLKLYENNPTWNRIITSINEIGEYIEIEFSGEPIIITEAKTLIQHLPRLNGETDILNYHTGTEFNEIDGISSFKYRYIENLWGNVCVFIEGMSYNGNEQGAFTYASGEMVDLGYVSPQQNNSPGGGAGSEAYVVAMGFDINNPSVMLPELVGGASPSGPYGDAWFYSRYSANDSILTFGLTWDLKHYAGLFAYRVANPKNAQPEHGARFIYR